jgi:hypothetical protein
MTRCFALALSLSLTAGCSEDVADQPPTPSKPVDVGPPCEPGELLIDDGTCRAAGLPPDLPPPGPLSPPLAGVPADACHEGFEADGEGGCRPILPDAACPSGLMAIPGDRTCREIAPCGTAPWGDIPLESGAEFVDGSFTGVSDGGELAPWKTIQAAIDAAAPGGMVAIAAGSYLEDILIAKSVRVWGRCPALVEIVGVIEPLGIVHVSAAGTELHTLAVTGDDAAVWIDPPGGALMDRLWLHDLPEPGVQLTPGAEPSSLSGSLIERAGLVAIAGDEATFTLEESELRNTLTDVDGNLGYGLQFTDDARLTVAQTNLHDVSTFGMGIEYSELDLAGTVIASIAPAPPPESHGIAINLVGSTSKIEGAVVSYGTAGGLIMYESDGQVAATTIEHTQADTVYGVGHGLEAYAGSTVSITESTVRDSVSAGVSIFASDVEMTRTLVQRVEVNGIQTDVTTGKGVESYATAPGDELTIDECIVEDVVAGGVLVSGTEAVVRGSIFRDIQRSPVIDAGIGIAVQSDGDSGIAGSARVENCSVERGVGFGTVAAAGELEMLSTIVSDTLPNVQGQYGAALLVISDESGIGRAKLYGSVLEKSRGAGVAMDGGELDIEATVVREVLPLELAGTLGRGIEISPNAFSGRPKAVVRWSVVENALESGIFVWSSDLEIMGVVIRDIDAPPEDPQSGYGIAGTAGPEGLDPAKLRIIGSLVEGTRVGGVVSDGAHVEVIGTLIRDIDTRKTDGRLGYGMFSQQQGLLSVAWSRVERCASAGIGYQDSSGSIAHTTVREVRTNDEGLLGDGVVVILGSVPIESLFVEQVARAAVSSYSAAVTLHASTLLCSGFDFQVESAEGEPGTIDDLGGNLCGCPEADRECLAVSTGLGAPEPIGDLD